MNDLFETLENWNKTFTDQVFAASYFMQGMKSYGDDFLNPLIIATQLFTQVESQRLGERNPQQTYESYTKLLKMNFDLLTRYTQGSMAVMNEYNKRELNGYLEACWKAVCDPTGDALSNYFSNHKNALHRVIEEYPEAIKAIEPEFGFHFERDPESLVAETDRFDLRKVKPSKAGVVIDERMKPIIIIPPFVLGANILAFLPGEQKSYAHSFANRGIPTYIRIMKSIDDTPAMQTMTLEDDAKDTRYFCEKIKQLHGQPVTLNGYCQGGFSSLCNILSGQLDGLVDALITCVAPMDGTRSTGLGKLLHELPQEFNDLAYGTKKLPNGNLIADGELMGWVYKLKSIENSGPLITFYRDLMMLNGEKNNNVPINKTVAAINYWLKNERSDLPLSVTEMSYKSYTIPITDDGTLPVTMFGKKLNLKGIQEKGITWLLCYGEQDDLVEKEVALAPLDFVDAEVTPFPKGHVAIATSWSHPDSNCKLDARFGKDSTRGPVRFQLDLSEGLNSDPE
ncbi:MAG: metal transporter [Desulforhopalus sp.]